MSHLLQGVGRKLGFARVERPRQSTAFALRLDVETDPVLRAMRPERRPDHSDRMLGLCYDWLDLAFLKNEPRSRAGAVGISQRLPNHCRR